jgi:hypothetical protein
VCVEVGQYSVVMREGIKIGLRFKKKKKKSKVILALINYALQHSHVLRDGCITPPP